MTVNELITNSLKYAFGGSQEGDSEGHIRVSLVRQGEEIVLSIGDNGVGLPEDFTLESDSGFGLKLVRMLTKQLDGTLSIENREGVCSKIRCVSSLDIPVADPCAP